MKQPRFSLFTPSCSALVLPVVSSLLLSISAMGDIINEFTTSSNLGAGSNWSLGVAPTSNAGAGSHTDLLFTSTTTALTHAGTILYGESYNVTNGESYTIKSNRAIADVGSTNFRIGSTGSTAPLPTTFTNAVSGVGNDLVYLSNGSNLTFDGVNAVEGGVAPKLDLRLSTGNFNISEGSTLTIGSSLTGISGTRAVVVTGNGTTIFSGNNTYTGSTTVRNGTLEISGSNTGIAYSVNNNVNNVAPEEPVLKLSNVSALPPGAKITGSDSSSRDGVVDLAVVGDYTMSSYEKGNIFFTASSGSPTTLTFTDASKVTIGGNSARTFNNASSNLSIVFSSTLDIGGDVVANVTINGSGNTTVAAGILSTGTEVRSLVKSGSGTLTLNGPGEYAGTTTLNGGMLRLGHTDAVPGGIGATGGTSNLIFNTTSAVIGLTAASGDFLRTVGTGPDQVTANPTGDGTLVRRLGFAAYGGDRIVDFGAPIQLLTTSQAGRGLNLGAADSDSKVTLINDINLDGASRPVFVNGTAAVDAELSGVIDSPTATLVKSGAGTLALTGTNTYGSTSGGTEVQAGTLVVDGDSLSNTSKLVIDGGKVEVIGEETEETVDTLFFGEDQQIAGTWGSSASSALPAFQDDTRFSGTGVVVVISGPSAGGYDSWATLNSAGPNHDDDHDGDGVSNGIEYFLGGPSGNTTGFTSVPGVTPGTLSVTWTKGSGYTGTYGTHFWVETSTTLANPWTQETEAGNVTLSGEDVVFTFPAGTKNFARLKVTGP
jgi:autotransporter-associated beta strand protein